MERALAVDPTVYQYDEVYDIIEEKKAEQKKLKSADKKPKYIQSLLKHAERRKKEQERRYEREVQRERVAEGEQFKDKEAFVTSAYRAKLEEFRKMDEQEKHMEKLEAIMDVSKQKDLSGFYRHLYRQTTGEGPVTQTDVVTIKEEPPDSSDAQSKEQRLNPDENSTAVAAEGNVQRSKVRHYRKRRASSSDREDIQTGKRVEPTSNVNKDTPGSDESSSSSESSTDDSSDSDETPENAVKNKEKSNAEVATSETTAGNSEDVNASGGEKKEASVLTEEAGEPVPKPNVWEKRTVGAVFEAALERYYARKAARLAG